MVAYLGFYGKRLRLGQPSPEVDPCEESAADNCRRREPASDGHVTEARPDLAAIGHRSTAQEEEAKEALGGLRLEHQGTSWSRGGPRGVHEGLPWETTRIRACRDKWKRCWKPQEQFFEHGELESMASRRETEGEWPSVGP